MNQLTLYGYWRSSGAWRVRIALAIKNIAYTNVPVNLLESAQRTPEYHAKNPMEQVPTLEWNDAGERRVLTQSMAICRWLDAQQPEPALWPADPYLAARVDECAEIINADIQPRQNLVVGQELKKRFGCDAAAVSGWNARWIRHGLQAVETLAAPMAGQFLVGERVTIADCYLIPQLYSARRFGVDVADYPTLARIEATCAALPAFVAAHADNQPDAVR